MYPAWEKFKRLATEAMNEQETKEKPCGAYRKLPLSEMKDRSYRPKSKRYVKKLPEKPEPTAEELDYHSQRIRDLETANLCSFLDREFPHGDCELHTYWDKYVRSDSFYASCVEDHCYICKQYIDSGVMHICGVSNCKKVYHDGCLPKNFDWNKYGCPCHYCDVCEQNAQILCDLCPSSRCTECASNDFYKNETVTLCPKCTDTCNERSLCHVFCYNC